MRLPSLSLIALLLAAAAGCDGADAGVDGGPARDASRQGGDASASPDLDAGASSDLDAGASPDAGEPSVPDAGHDPDRDAGEPDAGALTCTAPLADCNGDPSDGCETDLETSPTSCGRCGTSCGGAACVDGHCEPEVLGSVSTRHPSDLIVDDTHVYLSVSHTSSPRGIWRIPKTGGAFTPLSGGGLDVTNLQRAGANDLYFSVWNGGIHRIPKSGGAASEVVGRADSWVIDSFVVAGSDAFIADLRATCAGGRCCSPGVPCSPGRIWRAALGSPASVAAQGENGPRVIAVDATHVYWGNDGAADAAGTGSPPNTPAIRRMPRAGGSRQTLCTLPADSFSITGLIPDGDHIYFATYGETREDGTIQRVAKAAGSTPERLVEGEELPRELALAAAGLVWIGSHWVSAERVEYRRVRLLPSGASAPVTLYQTTELIQRLTADEGAVYFTVRSPRGWDLVRIGL